MAAHERFLLGPLGYMQPLPSPFANKGVVTPVARLGGVRRAVTGRTNFSISGYKRDWDFSYPYLTVEQKNRLQAFWGWTQPRALRFFDPYISNLVSSDASMGGSESRTTNAFSKTAGELTRVNITTPVLSPFLMTFIDSAIQWTVPTNTAGILLADNVLTKHIPLRDLRPLILTMEVTGSGTVQALVRPYNLAGVAQTDVVGSPVVLNNTWQTVQVTYTPLATHISCVVGLSLSSATGIRIPLVTAIKFRDITETYEWSIGEGIGDVGVIAFDPRYLSLRYYDVRFTVREI